VKINLKGITILAAQGGVCAILGIQFEEIAEESEAIMAAARNKRRARAKGLKTPPTFQRKRKRTFTEKATIVLGIIIAVSMILALVVNIGGGRVF
jgi:hypothetical protein